jgi:hypothetical protein
MVWHDGPDFAALQAAAKHDPEVVARMLSAGLVAADPLAAQSIAELAMSGQAPPLSRELLEAAAPSATGEFRIRVGQALYALTGDERWSELVISVLGDRRQHWGIKLNAAMALAEFSATPAVVAAFAGGVLDHDYLVRYHCADGLLKAAGRRADISEHPRLFELIVTPRTGSPTDADQRAWKVAATMLTTMVRAKLD